tara:strand:+ start:152 stop:445 length:294 start_codon:yes stop_codon:yes gene_type:complete
MIPKKADAISALVDGPITAATDGSYVIYHDGQTPPTEEEIQKKFEELKADYDSKEYQRLRKYPPIEEQLDMLYWDRMNGTERWIQAIKKVKDKHPKK